MTHILKTIFPVAGMGTRYLPATKSIPKEMLTLGDRPLIQYAVEKARDAGIEEVISVSAAGKGALKDYFDTAAALEKSLQTLGKTDALAAINADVPIVGANGSPLTDSVLIAGQSGGTCKQQTLLPKIALTFGTNTPPSTTKRTSPCG